MGAYVAPMAMWQPVWETFWTPEEYGTKYPLYMITSHPMHRIHAGVDANPWMGDVSYHLSDPLHGGDTYRHSCWISPVDAKPRGIADGDLVRAHNDRGEMVMPAFVTSKMSPGTVDVFEGAWYDPNRAGIDRRGCTNVISSADRWTPVSFTATGPVEVEKF